MSILRLITEIDFLSSPAQLFYKGNTRHKSIIPGIISLIIVMLSVMSGIYFLVELFDRQNPKSFQFERFEGKIQRFNISNSSNGIFLYARAYNPITYLQYNTSVINLTADLIETGKLLPLATYQLGKCEYKKDFQQASTDLFNQSQFGDEISFYFCFKEEIMSNGRRISIDNENYTMPYLQYGISSNANIGIKFSLKRCENSTENNYSCLPDAVLNKIMYPVLFEIYGTDHYVDIRDYSNPLKSFINSMMSIQVANGNKMMSLVKLQQFHLVDHIGWLLNNEKSQVGYKFSSLQLTHSLVPEYSKLISEACIMFINMEQIIDRSYPTLQIVSAEIGGIFKFLSLLGLLITYVIEIFYQRLCFIKNIFEQLVDSPDFFKEKLSSQKDVQDFYNQCQSINYSKVHVYSSVFQKRDVFHKPERQFQNKKIKIIPQKESVIRSLKSLYYQTLDEKNVIKISLELFRIKKLLMGSNNIHLISLIPLVIKELLGDDSTNLTEKDLEIFRASLSNSQGHTIMNNLANHLNLKNTN